MDAEAAVRQFYKAMSGADASLLDEVLAPGFGGGPATEPKRTFSPVRGRSGRCRSLSDSGTASGDSELETAGLPRPAVRISKRIRACYWRRDALVGPGPVADSGRPDPGTAP